MMMENSGMLFFEHVNKGFYLFSTQILFLKPGDLLLFN